MKPRTAIATVVLTAGLAVPAAAQARVHVHALNANRAAAVHPDPMGCCGLSPKSHFAHRAIV
jgi:hypothetical protein